MSGPGPLGGSVGVATDGLLRGDAPGRPAPRLDAARAQAFGVDLDVPLDAEATLPVTPTGDLRLLVGAAAAERGLLRRALVAPGGLVHRPGYGAGLSVAPGVEDTPAWRRQMANALRRQALSDPRAAEARAVVGPGAKVGQVRVELAVRLRGEDQDRTLTATVG